MTKTECPAQKEITITEKRLVLQLDQSFHKNMTFFFNPVSFQPASPPLFFLSPCERYIHLGDACIDLNSPEKNISIPKKDRPCVFLNAAIIPSAQNNKYWLLQYTGWPYSHSYKITPYENNLEQDYLYIDWRKLAECGNTKLVSTDVYDGKIYTVARKNIIVMNPDEKTFKTSVHEHEHELELRSIKVFGQGRYAIVGGREDKTATMWIWDTQKQVCLQKITFPKYEPGQDNIVSICISDDEKAVYVKNSNYTVYRCILDQQTCHIDKCLLAATTGIYTPGPILFESLDTKTLLTAISPVTRVPQLDIWTWEEDRPQLKKLYISSTKTLTTSIVKADYVNSQEDHQNQKDTVDFNERGVWSSGCLGSDFVWFHPVLDKENHLIYLITLEEIYVYNYVQNYTVCQWKRNPLGEIKRDTIFGAVLSSNKSKLYVLNLHTESILDVYEVGHHVLNPLPKLVTLGLKQNGNVSDFLHSNLFDQRLLSFVKQF